MNSLAVPATICAGQESQLYIFATGGTGVYSYTWTPANSLNFSNIFNPIATPLETTNYNVLVTSSFFSASGDVTVNVEPIPPTPLVSVTADHLVSSATVGNQWYNNQGLIAGATSQTYYPANTNVYYVVVTNGAGCQSEQSNQVVFGFTNTNTTTASSFSVFPNPFSGKLYIEYIVQTAGNVKIVLYNSIGSEITVIEESEQISGNHKIIFDGSKLPAGIYYCKIFSNEGILQAKVIKN